LRHNNNDSSDAVPGSKKLDSNFSGIVNRAKEGLQSQQLQSAQKPPAGPSSAASSQAQQAQLNKIDSFDLSIDTAQLASKVLTKPLIIKDLDFSDLTQVDDTDFVGRPGGGGPPPPPPMFGGGPGGPPPPPPPMFGGGGPPPPPPPPPMFGAGPPGYKHTTTKNLTRKFRIKNINHNQCFSTEIYKYCY
jgi:hypothetical protein